MLCNAHADVLVDHCRRSNAGLFYSTREEFVECMHLLLADRELRERMGRNGKAYVDRQLFVGRDHGQIRQADGGASEGMNATLLRRVVFAAIFLTSFGIYVMRASTSGALREPPETGDGHDYDAIAFNVWQGRGFGYQWSDEDWRKPYEGIPRYRLLLTRQSEFYPTTYRPPAMPFLLSAVYAITGRSFTAWRVVNCGIMAGAVTTAAIISAQFAGIPAAVITAAILLQSRELTRYSGMFMTEPLATLMLALLAWTWVRNARDGWTTRRAIASGIAMGGLLAARTIFILTTPILLILPGRDLSFGSKLAWKTKAICLAVAIVVISPWWIRNIVVLDAFMPLGTQGGINLPMGFGPARAAQPGHLGIESWRWLARNRGTEARHRHVGSDAREAPAEADPQLDDGESGDRFFT